ncbi:precorrin-3B synthase [Reyranella sp.]|uniref:precorrin-3B synthase n=1 Tax=Reyranella sp. TaxID=1929291 RepID=UPI00272FB9D5|nr:precorrin-3B synthase [Reyranella sp.]MDP2375521.1 precorrin-3B synthase [Reyranella sp.]
MSMAAAVDVKGWCPGVLRPMQSGDGLIARVRPWCGAFGLDEARGLADTAQRFGNGHIDLTRRANLQIRGLSETSVLGLQDAMERLGLVDRDAEVEAGRNIMVSPLTGLDPAEVDVRPVARTLASLLARDAALYDLPSKFGFLVDGGGTVSIAQERADISLKALGQTMAVGLDTPAGTDWIGSTSFDDAARAAVAIARAFVGLAREGGRVRDLGEERFGQLRAVARKGLGPVGDGVSSKPKRLIGVGRLVVGVAAPFGRLEAPQLHRFAALAEEVGATDIRLSPWRALYVGARDDAAAQALMKGAHEIGLIVEASDPILRIDACPGAPACRSSSVDTRRIARRLAASAFTGSVHVSGCAKGCARSAPAALVLVGEQGRYNVIRNGTTRDVPERSVAAEEAGALLDVR